MLEQALYYASIGLSVIPVHGMVDGVCTCGKKGCSKPGKHPRIKWRLSHEKALTESELKALWKRLPGSNVGIVTGKVSGIAVIDIDGEEGVESLKEVGLSIPDLPPTPTTMTGGGGYHLIYKMPDSTQIKNAVGLLKNVDIRADGGMIIAPPSLHKSGVNYTWVDGRSFRDLDPVDFDFSRLFKLTNGDEGKKTKKKKAKRDWFEKYLNGVGEGERNSIAARLAGRYFGLGMTQMEVEVMLRAWNQANDPPIPVSELNVILDSIKARETRTEDDSLGIASDLLGMNLLSAHRITGDEPKFVLTFESGVCTMTVAQLLRPQLFQQAIAEATKKIVKRRSSKTSPTHDALVQLIMDGSEDRDAGDEATDTGEMKALVSDFVKRLDGIPNIDKGDDIPIEGSFIARDLTWIPLEELVYRGGLKWGMRLTVKSAAQRLKAIGAEREQFGKRVMWGFSHGEDG